MSGNGNTEAAGARPARNGARGGHTARNEGGGDAERTAGTSSGARPGVSAGHLLRLVREGRATTRGALQRATGLSRSTVGQRLDRLFAAGWLREGSPDPALAGTGGRPSARLEFDAGHAAVLAADLGVRRARAGLLDLAGTVLAERTGDLPVADGPDAVLDRLGEWFAGLLRTAGTGPEAVCGTGLALPGPVDWAAGTVVQPPAMPGWDGCDVREGMRRAYAAHVTGRPPASAPPVFADNGTNLAAFAERRAAHPDCPVFLLVKASAGIGAGIVLDGRVHRGADGGAGDIGHIRVREGTGALCVCGAYGCLATVAGGQAVARRLTEAGLPTASVAEVREHLAAGRPDAVRFAREAGRRVGEVLGTVVTLLNPDLLVIAGELAGPPFLTGVREELYQRALPRTTARLTVTTATLGDRAGLLGAASMVVEDLYAPDRADERLAALTPGA